MKYGFLNVLIAVGIVGGTMTAAHADDDWTNVVTAAKKEGTVSVYHAQLGAPHWKAVVKAFQDKYGIQVQEFDARASELTERIRVEQTSGRYIADVEFHGEATIVQQRQTDFVAEHGEVPNMHNLRPPFVADNWAIPAWVQVVCTLINTNMVPPQDEPKNWSDFLDPKWKGKMLSDDLSAIGSGSTMFTALYKAYGRPYLEKLIAQDLTIGRDLQQDTLRVARGEYPIFLQQIVAFASGLNGLPVKIVVPADGCPYTLIEGAVLRGAPHPNAARLFINHLLDMDSQVTYAKAWMGTTIAGVADRLTDPDAKRFADAKLLGTVKPEDRDPMQKLATEMFK
jgi:ABC-type Fe3+ transport system substrate-binding protein